MPGRRGPEKEVELLLNRGGLEEGGGKKLKTTRSPIAAIPGQGRAGTSKTFGKT